MINETVIFDEKYINQCIKNHQHINLITYIKETFCIKRDNDGQISKLPFCEAAITALINIVMTIELKDIKEGLDQTKTELLTELYRAIRNYTTNPFVQAYIGDMPSFLERVKDTICPSKNTNDHLIKVVLQFLINLTNSSQDNTVKVFSIFKYRVCELLKQKKHSYETSALLYYISLQTSLSEHLDFDSYIAIFELYKIEQNAEFLHFLLEQLYTYDQYWQYHARLDIDHRLTMLEIIKANQLKGKQVQLPNIALSTLTKLFISSANIIFQTVQSTENNSEPLEVSLLLEVISALCAQEQYLPIFQNDKDLLINTGVVLINIHKLGKEYENCFTSIDRLADVRQPNEEIRGHPAFGFKLGLIRIIGNLCWKSPTMQDLVREAELIPILLECCNMDARNPFIMQWAIFSIKNLSENNAKNQEFIAGLQQQGAVSSATLEEMGLTLQSQPDNTLRICSLDDMRNAQQNS